MFSPACYNDVFSRAELIKKNSGDSIQCLPSPSLDPPIHLTLPECLAVNAFKFPLNMAFNRDNTQRYLIDGATREIGPMDSTSGVEAPGLIASNLPSHASRRQWREHYAKWTFPIRTDAPRGLTWGPYSLSPDTSPKRLAEDSASVQEAKRRRIFAILPPPRQRLIVKLKIKKIQCMADENNSKTSTSPRKRRLNQSLTDGMIIRAQPKRSCNSRVPSASQRQVTSRPTGEEDSPEISEYSHHLSRTSTPVSHKLVDIMLSPSNEKHSYKRRIKLCVASQLKYAS